MPSPACRTTPARRHGRLPCPGRLPDLRPRTLAAPAVAMLRPFARSGIPPAWIKRDGRLSTDHGCVPCLRRLVASPRRKAGRPPPASRRLAETARPTRRYSDRQADCPPPLRPDRLAQLSCQFVNGLRPRIHGLALLQNRLNGSLPPVARPLGAEGRQPMLPLRKDSAARATCSPDMLVACIAGEPAVRQADRGGIQLVRQNIAFPRKAQLPLP